MRPALRVIIAALLLLLFSPILAVGQVPRDASPFEGRLTLAGRFVPYYRTHPLNETNTTIKRLIIVIHGTNRNADEYFLSMLEVVAAARELKDTAIIVPDFRTDTDTPGDDEYYWSDGGWKQGDYSKPQAGFPRISSFGVVAHIMLAVEGENAPFPNLKSVVLIGHSAGGQFLNRFAARMPLRAHERIIALNPGSYLYLDNYRLHNSGDFRVIDQPREPYNDYRHGLDDLNGTMSAVPLEMLRTIMMRNQVYYVSGQKDVKQDEHLPVDYASMVQGSNRLARWNIYRQYVRRFPEWQQNTEFSTVPGVGHSSKKMFQSSQVRRLMFKPAPAPDAKPPLPIELEFARNIETFVQQEK